MVVRRTVVNTPKTVLVLVNQVVEVTVLIMVVNTVVVTVDGL
jgi:hypothetical protein